MILHLSKNETNVINYKLEKYEPVLLNVGLKAICNYCIKFIKIIVKIIDA